MNLIILEPAKEELEEAIAYYEEQRAGLGDDFAEEFERAIHKILQFPGAWSRLTDNVRRCRLNRFQYGVVYTVRDEDVVVVAVMHLRRKPGYWADRL